MDNMHVKFILLFIFVLQINSLTCGGNCPDDSCDSCPCGTTPNVVDLNLFCSLFGSETSVRNCCKCIINKKSQGN